MKCPACNARGARKVPHPRDGFMYYKCKACGFYKPLCFSAMQTAFKGNCIQCPEEKECLFSIDRKNKGLDPFLNYKPKDNVINRISSKIFRRNVKLALDTKFFYKLRNFNDGINILKVNFNVDFYRDNHCPRLEFTMDIVNIRLISIEIYNVLHEDKQ